MVLIPPHYVKPYVRRGKSDATDAEAICEAMSRPKLNKNFVPVKNAEQQSAQMLMMMRAQFIARRTQLSNSIRGFAAEFGIVAPKGLSRLRALLIEISADATLPNLAREMFKRLASDYAHIDAEVAELDRKLMVLHILREVIMILATIQGIGLVGAMLLAIKMSKLSNRGGHSPPFWG